MASMTGGLDLGTLVMHIKADIAGFKQDMNQVKKTADGTANDADSAWSKHSKNQKKMWARQEKDAQGGMGNVGSIIKKGLGAMAAIGAATKLIDFGKQSVEAAADMQAMESDFSSTFGKLEKNAGSSIDRLAKKYNVVPERMKPVYSTTQAMLKGMGMSSKEALGATERATKASTDMAAKYNISLEDANGALRSYMKGNTDAGEKVGLFANQTQLASYAMKKGVIKDTKEWATLSDDIKSDTILKYAESTNKVNGAMNQGVRESKSYENQMSNVKVAWKTFQAVLGAPILTVVSGVLNKMVPVLTSLGTGVQNFFGGFKKMAKSDDFIAIQENFKFIGAQVKSAFDGISNATSKVDISGIFTKVMPYISQFSFFLADVAAKARDFVKAIDWQPIVAVASSVFGSIKNILTEVIVNWIIPNVKRMAETFGEAFQAIMTFWGQYGPQVIQAFQNVITVVKGIAHALSPVVNFLGTLIAAFMRFAIDVLRKYVFPAIVELAKTFNKAFASIKKFWDTNGKQILEGFRNWIGMIKAMFSPFLGFIKGAFGPVFKTVTSIVRHGWDAIKGIFSGTFKVIRGLIKIFTGVFTGDFDKAWDGVKDVFKGGVKAIGSIFGGLKDIVKDVIRGVAETIGGGIQGAINGAIDGINWILKKLGVTTIGHVQIVTSTKEKKVTKHAKGTNYHPGGLAMVNDQTGIRDNREMVIPKNGRPFIPQGRNVVMDLPRGSQVLPASMTQTLMGATGAPAYAKGIFGTAWENITDFASYVTHPGDLINMAMDKFTDIGGLTGTMADMAGGAVKYVAKSAKDFIKDLITPQGPSGSALLDKAIEISKGKPYKWAAAGPDAFDCSGLVMAALREFGVSYPHNSDQQYAKAKKISESDAQIGDLVAWSGHIGINAGDGKMWNAMSPESGIGYANISKNFAGHKWLGYARVDGMDGGASSGSTAGVGQWTDSVKNALKQLGLSTSDNMVAKVLRQIKTESGGNASAMGGTDGLADGRATGLMQVKPGTFNAYKVPGHGNIMNGFDNMLAGLNYAKHRYGENLSFLGNGHGYANGGLITRHQVAEIGEGNKPEMIIPLTNKPRAMQLLNQTMDMLSINKQIPFDGYNASFSKSTTTNNASNVDLSDMVSGQLQGNKLLEEVVSAVLGLAANPSAIFKIVQQQQKQQAALNSLAKG